ncbi:MAG: hypothetical protein ACLS7Y_07055 [Thomasclavelia spiroformis]
MKNREYYINLLKVEQMMSDDNYQYLELCEFSKAEHLLHQGQILEYLYILVSGRIKAVERLRMEQQFYQLFLIQSQLLEKLNF